MITGTTGAKLIHVEAMVAVMASTEREVGARRSTRTADVVLVDEDAGDRHSSTISSEAAVAVEAVGNGA